MGVPTAGVAGIRGRRAASVCASRSCSRLRGARVVIAGRRPAQRQAQAARLGSKAGFVRRSDRCVDERWAQLTGPRDVEELSQPPAEPAGCARHAQAISRASGERRCSRGDHDARGPSWTLGPGAARDQGTAPPLQMPRLCNAPAGGRLAVRGNHGNPNSARRQHADHTPLPDACQIPSCRDTAATDA